MTGWDVTIPEIFEVGRRAATLARMFNLREGLDASTDTLPKRFFQEFRNNNSATGKPLDEEATYAAVKWHYKRNGWDENGVPTPETLKELGIEEYAGALAAQAEPRRTLLLLIRSPPPSPGEAGSCSASGLGTARMASMTQHRGGQPGELRRGRPGRDLE
jgi:hypothetical protein